MGFQITTPTAIPLDPDGSHDSLTWGESGGPFLVPPAEASGLGSVVFASNDVNYVWQHSGRWSRAMRDRMAMADEGFLTSCVLSQGTWNTGGGTLSVTLTPTRLVIDVNGDGGTVIEVKAPAGSPEVLPANSDNYVEFDESGNYVVQSVANGAMAPTVTAGYLQVYKLVTDATELQSVGLLGSVAPFPCLGPDIGAVNLYANTATTTGALVVGDTSTFAGDCTFNGEISATQPANFSSQLNVSNTGTFTCMGAATFSAPVYEYTHTVASDWRDSFRPSWRTFAVAGTVAGGGETTRTPITTTTGSQLLFSINDLTPSTNSAFVAFDVEFMIAWSADANPPTGAPGLKTSVTWTATATYDAGTWASPSNGTQQFVGASIGASTVALGLDSGQITLDIGHDLGVENRGYRWSAAIKGRIMQMAT